MHCPQTSSRRSPWFRFTVLTVLLCFGITPVVPVTPASARQTENPTGLVMPSPAFAPAVMRGIKIHPDNPFAFNFIIDTGEQDLTDERLQQESARLIKYFLAALTVPEQDLWVNLTPGEEDRIVASRFGTTAMARDMLAQDFLLKQFSSSLMYPDGDVGRAFWERVYRRAHQRLGRTDIPLNSLSKVWIVPGEAKVYENEDGAYVIGTRLKVMLEDEYARGSDLVPQMDENGDADQVAQELIKEILIPEIEREVNEGEHFARLRQIYHSLVLATWYKRTLRNSILTRQYADQNKVQGVDEVDGAQTKAIYEQYMQAVRQGVYDYIREDYDPVTRDTVPRRYMSGGLEFALPAIDQATFAEMQEFLRVTRPGTWKDVMTQLRPPDAAMFSWKKGPEEHGRAGYPISQHPDLTLSPAEMDVLAAARGTARRLSPREQLALRDLLVERDNLYRSSATMDYFEDRRFNRRDYNRRGTRTVVFSQMGSLFFFDREYYLGLPEEVRRQVGANAIVLDQLNDLEMYNRDFAPFTNAVLAMMLEQRDWTGRQVIDVGAGEGVLGIVAFKLGAGFVEAFDSEVAKLETAKNQFRLNGMAANTEYRVHAGDLRNADFLEEHVDQIRDRIERSATASPATVISNIGYWPAALFTERERQYVITNQKAFDIAEQLPQTDVIIAGGYNVHDVADYGKTIKRDLRRLGTLGFEVRPRPINYHQTDLIVALTAVRSDAAILGGGRVQEWIRRMRMNQSRPRGWPAWGRARELDREQVSTLMDMFRTDPGLITISWEGELSPGQPYGQFELNGKPWIREDAYIRRNTGPGELVMVRLGPLFLIDRTYYLDLDEGVQRRLGTNAVIIPRLNDSPLNSTLFRLYNSSTAMAMLAQGDFSGHHVIDVGSGDGLLALIAHKLGAVHSELIERDKFSVLRATHVMTLNGLDPEADFTIHLGDVTDEKFVREESQAMIRSMERSGAAHLSMVANIGQWDDYYGPVNNGTVIRLSERLPPVDRLILGGYDVSDPGQNRVVVGPDADSLRSAGFGVEQMTLQFAGQPMTVAMVARPQDQPVMGRLETIFEESLGLDPDRFERSQVNINGRAVGVTQYVNAQFEEVPFFTVGDFMVVNQQVLDRLSQQDQSAVRSSPGVMVLDEREFSDAFGYERWEGYGGFTIATMAAMIAFKEQIEGRTFVDFGAGTGVLSILAGRLGAKRIIAIEGREEAQDVLTVNLRKNGLADVTRYRSMIESVDALETGDQPVFGLNLPYFGVLAGSGEPSGAFQKAFDLIPSPAVAFLSGGSFGRGSIDDYVIRQLHEKGAKAVVESTVTKQRVSDIDLSTANVLTAVFSDGIVRSEDNAIFSRLSRRRLARKAMDLADRYFTRIPPHFPEPSAPVYSLIQYNPYFDAFLRSLDIDVIVPPGAAKQGVWKFNLPLDQDQARRLMDRLSQPDRIPQNQMPKSWSLIFYGKEPLLLIMQGVGWNSLGRQSQESAMETYARDLSRRGLTEEYLQKFMQELPRLNWARALALMPVKSEQVSIRDQRHMAWLEQWLNDMNDGPVFLADTLFELTPVENVTSPIVTAWGSYNPVTYDGYLFRSGIKPQAGETVYVLGTGVGADAIYTAQQVGGDIRVIASEIDPYQVANARVNVRLSDYADKIQVVQGNLFDFTGAETPKADRIYFNLPIDSLHAGRKRDPQVGDPGMRLLQRLLKEAGAHLNEGGTLEVTYMARPQFLYHVYSNGWKITGYTGEDLFDSLVPNAHLQPWKYLRFTLQRQTEAEREKFTQAAEDMRFAGGFEMKSLKRSQQERVREISWRWGSERTLTGRLLHMAADGVLFYARSNLKPGPRAVKKNRLTEPPFEMFPQSMVILDRVLDQSVLAEDSAVSDQAMTAATDPSAVEPWEEKALVRFPAQNLEGVITGRPFVKEGKNGQVPGYVIELKGLPWKPGQETTRIVSQQVAHRFLELLEPARPTDEEKEINAALKTHATALRGLKAAAAAKVIGVPAVRLRTHLQTYPGLVSKYGIDYQSRRSDQAQLAVDYRALGLKSAVSGMIRDSGSERDKIYAPDIAARVLAGYALVPGRLLPKPDRHNGTVLSGELSKLLVASDVLLERLSILEIQEALDAEADRLFTRVRSPVYPAKVDYRTIGALFQARRGAMTRKDAAAGIGVGQATVKKIEEWSLLDGDARYTAGAAANLETLLKFMNFYGIQAEQLFGREPRQTIFAPYTTGFVGPNIKSHRDRQGLTIDEMAARMDMNRANYDRLEAGGYNPSFDVLVRVARALGVSLDALLRPNLVLEHQPRRVADGEQWDLVRTRYSQEGLRLRLRELRDRRGLSVQQVADALGRAPHYVGQMENARDKTYFIERVKRMADFYGVSLFYLVTGLRTQGEGQSPGQDGINGAWLRQNLRTVREYRGLRRRDVDRLAGIPTDVVQRVEREGEPLFDYFVKISAALQVPMDLLLGDPSGIEEYLRHEDRLAALGHTLKQARGRTGQALADVADVLQIPATRLRRIEEGQVESAPLRDVVALANYYRLDFITLAAGMSDSPAGPARSVASTLPDNYETVFARSVRRWLTAADGAEGEFSRETGLTIARLEETVAAGKDALTVNDVAAVGRFFRKGWPELFALKDVSTADAALLSAEMSRDRLLLAVREYLAQLKAGEEINAREAALAVLSKFSFARGELVPEEDRENGTVLADLLRGHFETVPAARRPVVSWMANIIDETADTMSRRKRAPKYATLIDYKAIGQLLFDKRGKTSLKEVATQIGISIATLTRFEKWRELEGRDIYEAGTNISLATLLKVMNHYEIHADQLFGFEPPAGQFQPYSTEFVGENIYDHRKRNDLTLDELGAKVKTSRTHVDKWESGEKNVSLHYLVRIARAFNVSLDTLLRENVVVDHTLRRVDDEEQWIALHDRFDARDVRDRLRRLRTRRGLSTYQLAEALDMSQAYVTGLENVNHEDVTIERLRVFADYFGVSLFYLATGLQTKGRDDDIYRRPVDMDALRANVRLVMTQRGWTGHDLERQAGLSRGYISKMNSGQGPLFFNFVRLATALEVPMDLLMGDQDKLQSYLGAENRYVTLGDRLRITMEQQEQSLDEISAATGIPANRLKRIVSGNVREALLRDLVELSAYLGLDFIEMYTHRRGEKPTSDEGAVDHLPLPQDFEADLGAQIADRAERLEAGLWDLSDDLGFDTDRISRIIKGKHALRLYEFEVLTRYLEKDAGSWLAQAAGIPADAALLNEAPGGIDFRADTLPLEVERESSRALEFDLQDPQAIQIDGLVPVIINITPVTNIPLWLGLKDPAVRPLADLPQADPDPLADPRQRMIAALTAG